MAAKTKLRYNVMYFCSIGAKILKKIYDKPMPESIYCSIFRKEWLLGLSLQKKAKNSMFGSIEFYVVAVFIAAAVIGLAAMPRTKGEARTFLFAGELAPDSTPSEAGIVARVDDRGRLEIYRYGLEGISMEGAYSLAVKITGFDVTIEERLTAGSRSAEAASIGYASIDCLASERYHIQYRSEVTGRSAAFSINMRPGNEVKRLLG